MQDIVRSIPQEGRKFTHPWQPTRLNGWNKVCPSSAGHSINAGNDVSADHGFVSEHSATSGEDSFLRSAKAGHSRSKCLIQSSTVTQPTHTPVARPTQMAALLRRQQMRPHAKSQNSLQLCSTHGNFPDWADQTGRTSKPAAICAQLHPWARARPQVQGYSVKGGLLLHLKSYPLDAYTI